MAIPPESENAVEVARALNQRPLEAKVKNLVLSLRDCHLHLHGRRDLVDLLIQRCASVPLRVPAD